MIKKSYLFYSAYKLYCLMASSFGIEQNLITISFTDNYIIFKGEAMSLSLPFASGDSTVRSLMYIIPMLYPFQSKDVTEADKKQIEFFYIQFAKLPYLLWRL